MPGAEIERTRRPRAIAIGDDERPHWARGRVFDCRDVCGKVHDFAEGFSSDLDLDYLRRALGQVGGGPGSRGGPGSYKLSGNRKLEALAEQVAALKAGALGALGAPVPLTGVEDSAHSQVELVAAQKTIAELKSKLAAQNEEMDALKERHAADVKNALLEGMREARAEEGRERARRAQSQW